MTALPEQFVPSFGGREPDQTDLPRKKDSGDPLAELLMVHDRDDRSPVDDTRVMPFRCIAHLEVTRSDGSAQTGTGWLIGGRTVLTAAHVVYTQPGEGTQGGPARSVVVRPGRVGSAAPFGEFVTNTVRAAERWVNLGQKEFDYAVIYLDEKIGDNLGTFGFGYYADADLSGLDATVAGYPLIPPDVLNSRPPGTLWFNEGPLDAPSAGFLNFHMDTTVGQSGGPVFVKVGNQFWGIGVISVGGDPNQAVRITRDIYSDLLAWRL